MILYNYFLHPSKRKRSKLLAQFENNQILSNIKTNFTYTSATWALSWSRNPKRVVESFPTAHRETISTSNLHTKNNLSKHFFSTNTILITSDQQHCCCDSSHGFTFSLFFLDNHRLKSSSSSFSTSIFSFVYFPSDTSSSAASVSDPRRQSHCLLSVLLSRLNLICFRVF